jgi:hypothetical protein
MRRPRRGSRGFDGQAARERDSTCGLRGHAVTCGSVGLRLRLNPTYGLGVTTAALARAMVT